MFRKFIRALLSVLLIAQPTLARPLRLPGPAQATVTVANNTAFTSAFVAANAGKVLVLAPGVTFNTLTCPGTQTFFSPAISVAGGDAGNPPVVNGVTFDGCNGIAVRGLKILNGTLNPLGTHDAVILRSVQAVTVQANEMTDPNPTNWTVGTNYLCFQVVGQPTPGAQDIHFESNNCHNIDGGILIKQNVQRAFVARNNLHDMGDDDFVQVFNLDWFVFDHNFETNGYFTTAHMDTLQNDNGAMSFNFFITYNTYTRGIGVYPGTNPGLAGPANSAQGMPFLGNDGWANTFAASVSGSTMTVSACTGGPGNIYVCTNHGGIGVGQILEGPGTPLGLRVIGNATTNSGACSPSPCTGSSATGTYALSQNLGTLASGTYGTPIFPPTNITEIGNQIYGAQSNGANCGDCQNFLMDHLTVQEWSDFGSQLNWNGVGGTISNNIYSQTGSQTGIFEEPPSAVNTQINNTQVGSCANPPGCEATWIP